MNTNEQSKSKKEWSFELLDSSSTILSFGYHLSIVQPPKTAKNEYINFFSQKNVKIDIVAGTSIGGVNAAIIAGSKNEKHPEQFLEEFWLELADSFVDLDKFSPTMYPFFWTADS